MQSEDGVSELRQSVDKWGGILGHLTVGERTYQELAPLVDRTERTVQRAARIMESQELVIKDGNTVQLTQLGLQLVQVHSHYLENLRTLNKSQDLIVELPADAPVGCAMMDGVEINTPPESVPDVAFESVEIAMRGADQIRGMAPDAKPYYVAAFADHIIKHGTDVELLLSHDTIANLDDYYREEWRTALDKDNFAVWPAESVPQFGLIIIDESEVWLGVYREGSLIGTLHNDSRAAVEWAVDLWKRHRSQVKNPL